MGSDHLQETALLVDPEDSSAGTREVVAAIISHEMAHQWFGDLVTMEWWDDLWLNESFASWMGDKAVDYLHPEWEMWTQFLTNDTTSALNLDGLRNSHPIEQEVNNPAEIGQLFDAISYSKGGSILRMLEHYLGADAFQRGLQVYIERHQYENARTRDLWDALGEASGQPVSEIMDTWTSQTGYPVLEASVGRSGDDIQVALSQSRFLYDDILGPREPDDTIWKVPVTARTASDAHPSRVLMESTESRLTLQPPRMVGRRVDQGQPGSVRVLPGEVFRRRAGTTEVADQEPDAAGAGPLGLQSDAYALAKAGTHIGDGLLEPRGGVLGRNRPVGRPRICPPHSARLGNLLSDEAFHPAFLAFSRRVFKPIGDRVGWDARPGEGHRNALLRSTALGRLGHFRRRRDTSGGSPQVRRVLGEPFRPAGGPSRGHVLDAAQRGDQDLYDVMWDLEKAATLHEEKMRFLSASPASKTRTCCKRPWTALWMTTTSAARIRFA